MTDIIDETTRKQIIGFLPGAIQKAITSYESFVNNALECKNPTEFMAFHRAAKTAAGHLELLLKLTKMITLPDKNNLESDNMALLISVAEERIQTSKQYEKTNEFLDSCFD